MQATKVALLSLCALTLVLAGCSKEADPSSAASVERHPPKPPAAPVVDAAAAPVLDEAGLTAILATADAADGVTDMTVTKCAGCQLGMPGKAEHSVTAHGYTLHFCSPECKAHADAGVDAVIAALK